MTKHLPALLFALASLLASPLCGQEPVTLTDNPLEGLIDAEAEIELAKNCRMSQD